MKIRGFLRISQCPRWFNKMLIIFFHFLQVFLTFPFFFDTFHQNHPKTIPLFNGISHFLTTFCQKSSLFCPKSSLFRFRFRADSAHLRNLLLFIQHSIPTNRDKIIIKLHYSHKYPRDKTLDRYYTQFCGRMATIFSDLPPKALQAPISQE